MTAPDRSRDMYERHMDDPQVGQLQRLRDITGEQLAAYPFRSVLTAPEEMTRP
ncbi:hypothetical protein ACQUSR_33825 [Streptomyces sp. P1-3]|uniref:hypothetical protein n=1 Tax=Streptomyces sp. P1-3 TaxID=3421658 RepID=UPI003D35F64C